MSCGQEAFHLCCPGKNDVNWCVSPTDEGDNTVCAPWDDGDEGVKNKCVPCGRPGWPCCYNDTPRCEDRSVCDFPDKTYPENLRSPSGRCSVSCLNLLANCEPGGKPCCPTNDGSGTTVCNPNSKNCENCGGWMEPCCEGNHCDPDAKVGVHHLACASPGYIGGDMTYEGRCIKKSVGACTDPFPMPSTTCASGKADGKTGLCCDIKV